MDAPPVDGSRLDRRLVAMLLGLAVTVTAVSAVGIGVRASYGAQTAADEPQYLLSALSLWEDRDLDIADELADERFSAFHEGALPTQTLARQDGTRISPHDPLLPTLLAVPTGLGGWVGAKAAMAVAGGALAALTAWTAIARFGVSRPVAVAVTAGFALSPPLAVYSTQVYPEVPAALFLLAGFAAVTGPFGRRATAVFVTSVVALPWLAVKFVPLAAVLAAVGLRRAASARRTRLVVAFGVAAVVYVLGHVLIYDGLTAYAAGDHFVGGEFTAVGTDVNLWGRSTRLLGLLIDRGFGIAGWQPAYLFLPFVATWHAARSDRGARTALGLVAAGWTVASFVALTMHGWWFPGRQIVVVLPLVVVLVAGWAARAGAGPAVTAVATGGVLAFTSLLAEGLAGRLTWVVDFDATVNPIRRLLALGLPDYMAPTAATWVLHGLWVVAAGVAVWTGWVLGARSNRSIEPNETREKEPTW